MVPVVFDYEAPYFYIGGLNMERSRKFRNVDSGHDKVALVIDDLASTSPWIPRSLRIYGIADVVDRAGPGRGKALRITPTISWSSNLEGREFGSAPKLAGRRSVHEKPG